jgi:hypothetical protein
MKTGRWRVKLDVPEADLTEMLPATRILSQSKDPEVAYRSKEFFMAAVSQCGFVAESLTEQLQVGLKNFRYPFLWYLMYSPCYVMYF